MVQYFASTFLLEGNQHPLKEKNDIETILQGSEKNVINQILYNKEAYLYRRSK